MSKRNSGQAKPFEVTLTKFQLAFLDALVDTGEVSTSRTGVLQYLLKQELEQMRKSGRVPDLKMLIEVPENGES